MDRKRKPRKAIKKRKESTIRGRNAVFIISGVKIDLNTLRFGIREETPAERGARINGDGVPRTYASDYAEDHERHEHTGT